MSRCEVAPLLSSIGDPAIVIDGEHRVIDVNEAARRRFGGDATTSEKPNYIARAYALGANSYLPITGGLQRLCREDQGPGRFLVRRGPSPAEVGASKQHRFRRHDLQKPRLLRRSPSIRDRISAARCAT
jgi:PAS domain-containing protein